MARRKKEAPEIHRDNIAKAAEELFTIKGFQHTTMDEIAKKAGYSKATLYVYYLDKKEIISYLTLKSMEILYIFMKNALQEQIGSKAKYNALCHSLLQYQEEYPFYLDACLSKIPLQVSGDSDDCKTDSIGEKINDLVSEFIQEGIKKGTFKANLNIYPTVFTFWGMLTGIIQLASNKDEYIEIAFQMTKAEFLTYSFNLAYQSIKGEETNDQ